MVGTVSTGNVSTGNVSTGAVPAGAVPSAGVPPGAVSAGNLLGSLDRGLAVLEFIARRGEARLAELAQELGTSRTTMFRVLETLRGRGFAEHVAASHTYRLGPGARSLAARATRSLITQLAEPVMAELRNETGETINLVGVHGGRLVYEVVLEGGYALRSLPSLGQTVSAHCSALGKAVLAFSPPAMREVLLGPEPYERFNEHTITTRSDLDLELAATRERGFAIDDEENETGLSCVAAVICGADGRPAWAISVSGLTDRMQQRDLDELGRRVQARCSGIGAALGT
ncbi:MAG: IclR family transcriptional regulator [Streptosporangiaceae bacterium]